MLARPRSLAGLVSALSIGLSLSCASTGERAGSAEGAGDDRFPSAAELAAIAGKPAPSAVPGGGRQWDVSTWTLAGPLPDGIAAEPHAPADEIERRFATVAAGQERLTLTEGMHCVAREVGRFYLTHGTYPGERVRSFIVGRCGATAVGVSWRSVQGDLEGWTGDAPVPPEWMKDVDDMLAAVARQRPDEAGVALVREGTRVIVLAVSGRRRALLEPLPLVPGEDGVVEVRGTLLTRGHRVSAVVTQGRFEAVECGRHPDVALPQFAFSCPTNREDAFARIEVGSFVEGRVLGDRVVDLLARPAGAPGERYERVRYAEPRVVEDAAVADQALLELLNQVRADAGLAPVTLSPTQNQTARALAPHFFGAMAEGDDDTGDKVALGMMAGWNVSGVVESGSIAWSVLERSRDLAELLSAALESPSAREALLARDVDQVALGVVALPEQDTVAALMGAYSVFEPTGFEEEAQRAYSRLTEQRVAAGKEPQRRLLNAEPIALELAAAIEAGEKTPESAMRSLLARTSQVTKRGVRAFTLPVRDLDELEFPKELLLDPAPDVALAVATTREEGEAWGHVVVLVIMAVDGKVRTALVDEEPPTSPALAGLAPR